MHFRPTIAAAAFILSFAPASRPALAATFEVTSTAEGGDARPGDGVCATVGGACTLRAAVDEANALRGMDRIVLGPDAYVVTSQLQIRDSVSIVGTDLTQISGGGRNGIFWVQTVEYLVCDAANNSIVRFDRDGRSNGALVRNGSGDLRAPSAAVPVSGGALAVAGWSGLHRFDSQTGASLTRIAPILGGPYAPSALLFHPTLPHIYVADFGNGGVLRYDVHSGTPMGNLVTRGAGGLGSPGGIAYSRGSVFVSSTGTDSVLKFDARTGAFQSTFVPRSSGGLHAPRGLVFAPDGSLLVANWYGNSVLRFDGGSGAFLGELVRSRAGGLVSPSNMALGPDNSLLVVSNTRQIKKFDLTTGAFLGDFVTGALGDARLDLPACILERRGGGRGPILNLDRMTLRDGRVDTDPSYPTNSGAALHVELGALVALRNVVVRDNTSGAWGGAIHNRGRLELLTSEVHSNRLPVGGGGVTSSGGGIYNSGVLILERSSVSDNFATRGGGIANTGRIEVRNSTISANNALAGGGGIRNAGNGYIAIASSTITRNNANTSSVERDQTGGGIQNLASGRVSIGGSILAGNSDNRVRSSGDYSPDCHSLAQFSLATEGSNLFGVITGSCNVRRTWITDLVGTAVAPLDPRLAHFPSGRGYFALRPDSPAIDASRPGGSSPFHRCPALDQPGNARPRDGDGDGTAVCDIGAYEY